MPKESQDCGPLGLNARREICIHANEDYPTFVGLRTLIALKCLRYFVIRVEWHNEIVCKSVKGGPIVRRVAV